MSVFFKEGPTYDPENFAQRLQDCILKWEDNDDLQTAADDTWKGFFKLYNHPET
jgi:hypothetical protein